MPVSFSGVPVYLCLLETLVALFIEIGGRRIGAGYLTYIVAEMSANHGQSFDRAVELVKTAKARGADAGTHREQDWVPLAFTTQR
jgi:hypothetical protein